MPPPTSSEFRHPWSRDQFRAHAHAAVDFIISYLERLEQPTPPWPVASQVEPGYLRPKLPREAPERPAGDDGDDGNGGQGFSSFLGDLERLVLPGLTHWQSPNFFSYYPANSSLPGILGEMLCAAFNVIGFSWAGSPAATELEGVVLDWLAKALGLPECFLSPEAESSSSSSGEPSKGGGCIQSTASDAALVALLAARARALARAPTSDDGDDDDNDGRGDGDGDEEEKEGKAHTFPPGSHNEDTATATKLTVYTSKQAHCCVQKACMVTGIPFSRVREVEAPESNGFEIDAAALRAALEEDLRKGFVPCLVVATVGTTPSCAVDDLGAVAAAIDAAYAAAGEKEKEKEEKEKSNGGDSEEREVEEKKKKSRLPRKPWLHVDAAYAGVAALCPEYRDIFAGAERVDSLSTNFHKWCLTNFDCACFWVKDSSWLSAALSLTPSYLVARNNSADYRNWQVPLGRRFRSLKLWLVLRTYGLEGLRSFVRHHCELASWFAGKVQESTLFELAAPPRFSLVCFRVAGEKSEANSRKTALLVEKVNAQGKVLMNSTQLGGEETGCCAVRLAIGGSNTARAHVELAWRELVEVAEEEGLGGGAE